MVFQRSQSLFFQENLLMDLDWNPAKCHFWNVIKK